MTSNASSNSAAAPRLAMHGVVKRFGETTALDGVSFSAHAGEIHALVGENGAGKSTLMKILAGALRADEGEITLDGRPYRPHSPADGRAAGVAMIFQELSLAPHLSIMENVFLGKTPRRGPFADFAAMRQRTAEALTAVGRPRLSPDARTGTLSAADRQLVEIARAVALDARVLVLDEPTSSLGERDAHHVFDLLRRLRDRGLAIIYISHFLEEIAALTDRFTVLRDGKTVLGGRTAEVTPRTLVQAMVGRDVTELYPKTAAAPGETLLDIEGLRTGRMSAGASLTLRRGEVLGIAGLVGSGRTELLRAIFGLDRARAGTLRIAGVDGPVTPRAAWHSGMGFVSEDRKTEGLALSRSIAENLAWPCLGRLAHGPWITPRAIAAAAAPWIAKLGIKTPNAGVPVGRLSGGNQQKVAIARLLLADADVILLDEPTRGVDLGAKAEIYRVIDRLAHDPATPVERRKAVIVVSSYLPELLGIADRIAVMCRGSLGRARAAAATDEKRIMLEATGTGVHEA